MDIQADLTHYNYANIGKTKLSSVTIVCRYERQATFTNSPTARRANRYAETEFPADGAPLTPYYRYRIPHIEGFGLSSRTYVWP